MVTQEKLNRLFWHSRRGMLELDQILVPFVRQHYVDQSPELQDLYELMLEEEDQDLFSWLVKCQPAPQNLQPIIDKVIAIARQPS